MSPSEHLSRSAKKRESDGGPADAAAGAVAEVAPQGGAVGGGARAAAEGVRLVGAAVVGGAVVGGVAEVAAPAAIRVGLRAMTRRPPNLRRP